MSPPALKKMSLLAGSPSKLPLQDQDEEETRSDTYLWTVREVVPRVAKDLEKMKNDGPVGVGGIQPYSKDAFLAGIKKDGFHECTVTLADFNPTKFAFGDNAPAVGSILSVMDAHVTDDHKWQPAAIPVLVQSVVEEPKMGELNVICHEEVVAALRARLALAHKDKDASAKKTFYNLGLSIKVRFEYEAESDEGERKKWYHQIALQQLEEGSKLVGIRKIKAVYDMQQDLKKRPSCKGTAKDVADFYYKVNERMTKSKSHDPAEGVSKKQIEQYLALAPRFSAELTKLMIKLESDIGSVHPLASIKAKQL